MSGRDSYSPYQNGGNYVSRSGRYDPRDRDPRDRVRDTRGADNRGRNGLRYENYTGNHEYRDQRDHRDHQPRYNGNRGRYDDRNGYSSRYDNGRDSRRTKPQEAASVDPDLGLSKEEIIAKYEKKLMGLLKYPSLEVFPIASSQWGAKPKGFEKVTAQRAKMSGLFPLPGAPRPVDLTKVESDNLGDSGVLLASLKIDPADLRNACTLIVRDVDFALVDYLKLAEYFNRFLCAADASGTSVDNNIEKKRKTRDNRHMLVEFKSNTCATLAYTLDGRTVPGSELFLNEEAHPADLVLRLERPGEYVVQCLPPYDSTEADVTEEVRDSPRKLTVYVEKHVTETQLSEALASVARLRSFQLLREIGTKELMGIAFVEFFVDPKRYPSTKAAISLIADYVDEATELELVKEVRFSCLEITRDKKIETSIQDCPIDVKTLKALVRNEYVPFHPKLKVIQLINAVTAADLSNDETYNFIRQDILDEVRQFGTVVLWKIPKPPKDFVPGLQQYNQPGLGKIYLEFEDEKTALNALMGTAGRSYNDRTVLCAFYSHSDYLKGLL